MSVLSCNGRPVLRARVTMPRVGVWTAEVSMTGDAPTGDVVLEAHGDALRLKGYVAFGGTSGDTASIRIVGGAGGFDRIVPAQSYRALPVRVMARDILDAAGEVLSASSPPDILDSILTRWTREEGAAARGLAMLADAAGAAWRVAPDGGVWIGRESWSEAALLTYDVLDEQPSEDRIVLGVEAPSLLPGTRFQNRPVSLVVHTIDDDGVRTEVWFERSEDDSRLLAAFRRIVRTALSRVDYYALYPSRVVAQSEDGALELRPESTRLPGLSRVPLRTGLPGIKVKVAPGARVLLGFEEGDPARPVAVQWNEPGMIEIQIGGSRPVARMGDQVTLTMPPVVPFQAVLPNGAAVTGTFQITTPLIGTIITGAGKLKA